MTAKQETIALYAKQLKTPTFAEYESTLRQLDSQTSYEDFLLELMKKELSSRQENQQKRRIKSAGFPFLKTLDEFEFNRLKHVKEPYIWELASCDYIKNRQNIIMIGTPGTGKSHLSVGLGLKACQAGFKVKFFTAANLATQLVEARESKELLKLEKQLGKTDLLILDELSYLSFNRHQSELLFKVISDRSERSSIIVNTNLNFSQWTELFENTTMIAAMVDRLTFRSHVLDMNGDSYRIA